jgi:hypothetical protein
MSIQLAPSCSWYIHHATHAHPIIHPFLCIQQIICKLLLNRKLSNPTYLPIYLSPRPLQIAIQYPRRNALPRAPTQRQPSPDIPKTNAAAKQHAENPDCALDALPSDPFPGPGGALSEVWVFGGSVRGRDWASCLGSRRAAVRCRLHRRQWRG